MPSVKFPLNVNLESIDGSVDRAQLKNAYAEVASQAEVKVYSRPALQLAQGSFAAFGQGMSLTPDGQLFVVSGGDLYFPVPGQSGVQVSTLSAAGAGGFIYRALGNYVYALSRGATQTVFRASPPYSSFGSIGVVSTETTPLNDAVVNNGTLYVRGTLGNLHRTSNGTSWSLTDNAPTAGFFRLYSLNGTMFAYQGTLADALDYQYSTDGGNNWLGGTTTASGITLTNFMSGPQFDNRIWAVTGTGTADAQDDVAASSNGSTWTAVSTDAGFSTPARNTGATFAVKAGIMYAVTHNDTDYQVWSSSDKGATWSLVETQSLGSVDPRFSAFSIGGSIYAVMPESSALQRIFRLTGDGTLQGVTAEGSIDVPAGEVVTIIGTESGTTFIKTTTAAYTVSSGTITKVTDAQYPASTVPGAVYLNGRLYVMEPDGTIWNSAEDDFTSWAGTDFVNAEFEADMGVRLAKQGEYVIALGQFTTEAFYDAANPTGSPLDPVGSAVMLIGCAHAHSVAQVETSLVWVAQQKGQGSTFHKGRFVAFMRGYGSYDRISTPDVDRVLDADAFNEVYSDIVTTAGHVFYLLTLVDSDITLAYDFRSQLWGLWDFQTAQSTQAVTSITAASQVATAILASHGYSDGDHVIVTGGTGTFTSVNGTHNITVPNAGTFSYPITGTFAGTCTTGTAQGYSGGQLDISASCYFDNRQLVQLRTSGDVYYLDGTAVTDNGAPIDFRIRTRNWDGGSNREKFQGSLDVVGDNGTSTALIRYTDDDFQTYTPFKRVDLSLRRPRAKRGGTFSRRAVELRHTLSSKVGISALEAEIEPGEQ